jgi:hypothetical protein
MCVGGLLDTPLSLEGILLLRPVVVGGVIGQKGFHVRTLTRWRPQGLDGGHEINLALEELLRTHLPTRGFSRLPTILGKFLGSAAHPARVVLIWPPLLCVVQVVVRYVTLAGWPHAVGRWLVCVPDRIDDLDTTTSTKRGLSQHALLLLGVGIPAVGLRIPPCLLLPLLLVRLLEALAEGVLGIHVGSTVEG